MILDAADITSTNIDCDLCIVGAGAAGISLARELAGSSMQVVLLEGGGYQVEPQSQALYEGENTGHPYFRLDETRLRMFGGTTGHWGGACWPMEPMDFTQREWVPDSGWPIGYQELEPYYHKAQQICQVGPFNYDPNFWQDEQPAPLLPFEGGVIESKLYQNSPPTQFGNVYRDDLSRAANIKTILHANVTHLGLTGDARRLERVDVAGPGDRRFAVRARRYVLAAGGLEIPRLLLHSDDVAKTGIGNEHDLVGRYFMDHPLVFYSGTMLLDNNLDLRFYTRHGVRGTHIRGGLGFSENAQRDERILNAWIGFGISGAPGPPPGWRDNATPPALSPEDVAGYLTDVENLRPGRPGRNFRAIKLMCHSEQAPNPDSRVTLGGERDALGMRRLTLDWRLTDFDRYSVRRTMELLAAQLGAAGIGRLRLDLDGDEKSWSDPETAATMNHAFGSYHNIGTTRMSDDPGRGVVDRHCRMHAVANLYIAGSSVFPSCGYANPTLTIVALACRLADQLKTQRL